MSRRHNPDLVSGGVLAATGVGIVLYALDRYQLGTLGRMGPGMFPVGLGAILAVLGLSIAVQSLYRDPGRWQDQVPEATLQARPLLVILGTVIGFAAIFHGFGLIPAIVATTALASLAHPGARPRTVLFLAAGLSVASVVIFRVLLNIPFPLWRWPFG